VSPLRLFHALQVADFDAAVADVATAAHAAAAVVVVVVVAGAEQIWRGLKRDKGSWSPFCH